MILVFDTETTSTYNDARIMQLAFKVVDLEGKTLHEKAAYIHPGENDFKVNPFAFAVHKITQEMCVSMGEPIKDVLEEFFTYAGKSNVVVAHNLEFDRRMVNQELKLNNLKGMVPSGIRFYCSMQGTKALVGATDKLGRRKAPKLAELHRFLFDSDFEGAHNAFHDVEATTKCVLELYNRGLTPPDFL
jgi:DNA polymerase III epsilon subunit-like protein